MKRITKHLMTLILSAVMVMAMGLIVFADETSTYSLTIQNTGKTQHTFELYQIFIGDLKEEKDSDGNVTSRTLSNIKWGDGVNDAGKKALGDVAKKASDLNEGNVEKFGKDLVDNKYLSNPKPSQPVDAGGSYKFEGLVAGYYLVKDMDSSQSPQNTLNGAYTIYVMQVVGNVTAETKLDVPTVEKKVQDTNDSTNDSTNATTGWQDSADYDIGDDVPYQITGTMPRNIDSYTTYKYVFTDTMSKGLTYKANTTKIEIDGKEFTSSFNRDIKINEKDGSTTVTWTCDNLKGIDGVTLNKDTKVVVTYSAILNESAAIGAAGNPNTVYLTYSNNPNKDGEGDTGKTPEDKNIVFTYKTIVNKVDQDQKSLAGAAFKLEKKLSNGSYKTVKEFKAGEKKTFEFNGLDDGDYKLTETTTPAGYNTIDPIEFTISAKHDVKSDAPQLTELSGNAKDGKATFTVDTKEGSLTTEIENKKGSILPSTGGRGTTMIYIIGAALVVMAGIVLAMRKKMSSKES